MAKLKKKKASDSSLPAQERLILAAQEVLEDEKKYCKGRLNEAQIAMLQSMIPKKKFKGIY
jgi:hypothetical protein